MTTPPFGATTVNDIAILSVRVKNKPTARREATAIPARTCSCFVVQDVGKNEFLVLRREDRLIVLTSTLRATISPPIC
jgi:hypothetical protein